jgi:ketosteroid isomerase-like protein
VNVLALGILPMPRGCPRLAVFGHFGHTSIEGKVSNKAETLANAKATKYVSADYEDVKVTVFGDTAIATGAFKATGTDASGKPMDTHGTVDRYLG